MHLLNNAIDALDEQAESCQGKKDFDDSTFIPTICITTDEIEYDSAARICISDNGVGIPEQVRKCIFNPFFTTKPVGKGSGLGLSICHQIIVQKHSGTIICNSTPGEGTEFAIQIPLKQF